LLWDKKQLIYEVALEKKVQWMIWVAQWCAPKKSSWLLPQSWTFWSGNVQHRWQPNYGWLNVGQRVLSRIAIEGEILYNQNKNNQPSLLPTAMIGRALIVCLWGVASEKRYKEKMGLERYTDIPSMCSLKKNNWKH